MVGHELTKASLRICVIISQEMLCRVNAVLLDRHRAALSSLAANHINSRNRRNLSNQNN
jgi:hypothetical protein